MKAERWKRVNDLFQSAVERAPGERAAFLDEACHGDGDLRCEVESLLTSHVRAENFIELPAFEVAAETAYEKQLSKGNLVCTRQVQPKIELQVHSRITAITEA
jgi:hypothetical protein